MRISMDSNTTENTYSGSFALMVSLIVLELALFK